MPDMSPTEPDNEPEFALLLEYFVEIRNSGETPIKVPTRNFARHHEGGPDYIKQEWTWDLQIADGWGTIKPDDEYGFVQLFPNERACIKWKEFGFHEESLERIEIKLSVTTEFAERHNCWWGNLRATCKGVPKPPLKSLKISEEPVKPAQ